MISKEELIIEQAIKIGICNGYRASILLIKQMKLMDENITIDMILNVLELTMNKLSKEH